MINVIYWSGTGNTEAMAEAVVRGIEGAGEECKLIQVGQASVDDVKDFDKVAFGCPAMGAEELEETEMRPFMDSVNELLKGKKVLLFGSYEWADGEWMQTWEEEVQGFGAQIIDAVIAYDAPDDDAIDDCEMAGKALAQA
ncbi:flavodoxin [Peptoniphilus sp. MSJ-1]|uniref:Flavodoxin n=1 Tax=Peptoniphilus ovalis TaxID=2841503 RepID=A0ABS6FF49_9FIRM|nr:flavodoxin [Peptoniphilus ovalis]MBU5668599.1 flavodoxin [Peptoniphilus ovalis]